MSWKLKSCKKRLFGYKHNWGKWETYDYGDRFYYGYATYYGNKIGKYAFQRRHCFDCGKIQLSKQYV